MSQCDYIKFMKTAEILRNGELPAVLSPSDYTAFESYNLETTVPNTKNSYSCLKPTGFQRIFGIEKKTSGCATFTMCANTNTRPNRVLHSAQIPTPISRKTGNHKIIVGGKKTYTPITCQFTKGFVVRNARCSKHKCKCGTTVLSAY